MTERRVRSAFQIKPERIELDVRDSVIDAGGELLERGFLVGVHLVGGRKVGYHWVPGPGISTERDVQ